MNSTAKHVQDNAFHIYISDGFNRFLDQLGTSLTLTTYQAGKVLSFGLDAHNKLAVFERTFPRSMGMALSEDSRAFLLATREQIYAFDNLLLPGQRSDSYDALFAPHHAWITGNLDIHDLAYGADGMPVFVNTLFNCISTVEPGYSFKPLWKPPFISDYAAEDRCHLNGMAMENSIARYVTYVAQTNTRAGWREHREDGGGVIDTRTNETVVSGLSMPHSPRLYNGRLWLLNSGRGEFGWVDTNTGVFNPIALCPGFARGLAFIDNYAIVGLSEPRENGSFGNLPLQQVLEDEGMTPRCGIQIIHLDTGEVAHWMHITGVITELFDVDVMRGVRNASLIGLAGDDIRRMVSIAPATPHASYHPA